MSIEEVVMNDIHLENCDPSFSGMESGRVTRAAGLSNAIGQILS